MHHITTAYSASKTFRPGFLMEPLGWLTQRLFAAMRNDPELLAALFELDAYRMHALGLAFAHCDPEPLSPWTMKALTTGASQSVLKRILGRWPQGLSRMMRALPDTTVLAGQSYRALLSVLDDKASAVHLHHCQAISEPLIVALAALPPPMRRPAIFKLFDDIDGMDRFIAGLHYLCDRGSITFDCLVEELGALDQTEQVKAKITALVDRLPLPDRLPGPRIGAFYRVDEPDQIKALARLWQNCLGEHLHEVNEGTTLIYRAEDEEMPAAALLVRVNRLGWAVVDVKGPKNTTISHKVLSRHYDKFLSAGIPRLTDIAAIRSLLWRRRLSRR
jgi:hypothetical protein